MYEQQIINKYSAIEGNYEATVLQGVWHAYCDSGIMTDALSVNDIQRCISAGLCNENEDGMRVIDEMDLYEINDAVRAYDKQNDMDCVQCVNDITALGYDVEEFFDEVDIFA